jgi:uncharacterized protein
MKVILMIVGLVLSLSTSAHSASFDCNKASNFVEREVCADKALSSLDEQLSTQYEKINSAQGNWHESQLHWLKERNNCKTKQCLLAAYQERVLFFKYMLRNIVKKNTTLSELNEVSPLVIKNIYEKDKDLCSEVISSIKMKANDNFRAITVRQKPNMKISYLTTGGGENFLNVGGKAILWSKSHIQYETLNGLRGRDKPEEFIYADINNDDKPDFVVKHLDLNDISDGYGWNVYPEFKSASQLVIPRSINNQSINFSFRNNNINTSTLDTYVSKSSSRNFHYEFVTLNEHIYVLLMLHYGYSSVFQENIILADLDESYQIKNQFCHYELTMKK